MTIDIDRTSVSLPWNFSGAEHENEISFEYCQSRRQEKDLEDLILGNDRQRLNILWQKVLCWFQRSACILQMCLVFTSLC